MKKLAIAAFIALLYAPFLHAQTKDASDHVLSIGALTCGAGTAGKIVAHTTPLQYCDNAGTPTLQYAAYGNSSGAATGIAISVTTCTNQFVSAISAAGVGTCTTDTLAGAQHANQGTTTTLLHGNAAGNPSFGAVVSADLNITTSTCTNQFLTAISATGVGTCTTDTLAGAQHANQGTTITVLHGNGSGNPAFGAVVSADLNITTTSCTAPAAVTAISATGVGTCTNIPIPQNSKSAAYTTVLGDCGGSIYHPGADTTARTWTIDSNANVAAPIGCTITFVNDTSGGVITIAITSDTLVLAGAGTTGSRTLAANGIATATKVTSTRWMINGSGLT